MQETCSQAMSTPSRAKILTRSSGAVDPHSFSANRVGGGVETGSGSGFKLVVMFVLHQKDDE